MVLNLITENVSVHLGSYSNVHRLRANMVSAAIKYLKQFPKCKGSLQMVNILEESLITNLLNPTGPKILDYKKFKEFINVMDDEMYGLYLWVIHSNCDGVFYPEESERILVTLKSIYSFINDVYFEDNMIKLEKFYLYNIILDSVNNNNVITFC